MTRVDAVKGTLPSGKIVNGALGIRAARCRDPTRWRVAADPRAAAHRRCRHSGSAITSSADARDRARRRRRDLAARMLKPAATTAGVAWASWHTLRYTCGSLLLATARTRNSSKPGSGISRPRSGVSHRGSAFALPCSARRRARQGFPRRVAPRRRERLPADAEQMAFTMPPEWALHSPSRLGVSL